MKNKIIDKTNEIFSILINSKTENLSLLDGKMSEILFLHNYEKKISSKISVNKITENLNFLLHNYESLLTNFSFLFGLPGLLWLMKYVGENEKYDFSEAINIDDDFLNEYINIANSSFLNNNYDLFAGGIGLGLFLLYNNDENNDKNKLVENLINLYEQNLPQNNENKEGKDFNFGLSHGIPSVVIFLSKLTCSTQNTETVVRKMNQFILSHKSKTNLSQSLYPTFVNEKEVTVYNSRLAWCYGDLGIASAFWQSGKAFNQTAWKQEAISIMIHASKRLDITANGIIDACFCHGTSGVAHIFNRFYKETGMKEFDEARWYWLEKTLDLACHKDGLAGYKTWNGNSWQNDHSSLEGIAGIGLVLLGFLSDNYEDLNWDRCFLLS